MDPVLLLLALPVLHKALCLDGRLHAHLSQLRQEVAWCEAGVQGMLGLKELWQTLAGDCFPRQKRQAIGGMMLL